MKNIAVTIRISQEAKEKLDIICKQEHRSQGAQIEYWISQFELKEKNE